MSHSTDELFSVGELTAKTGQRVAGYCAVDLGTETVQVPVVLVRGTTPGPVLVVTAGIHGGEYVPMVAAQEFAAGLDPERVRGTVAVCLRANPAAFRGRTAFLNPADGENLNRSFPGDPAGSPTSRLATWLWT
jgi:predicted deacylase